MSGWYRRREWLHSNREDTFATIANVAIDASLASAYIRRSQHRGLVAMSNLFGDQLSTLLRRSDLGAKDLADEIGVDRSLVYRWKRNERIPRLDTDYVERIAEALALLPEEKQGLIEAQLHSLRLGAGTVRYAARRRTSVYPLVREARRGIYPPEPPLNAPCEQKLSTIGPAFASQKAAMRAVITLLENLPAPQRPDSQILLTSQGRSSLDEVPELRGAWGHALYSALKRGWGVSHLLRLERDERRAVRFVKKMLILLGTEGSYRPYYFNRYGILSPPYDLVVVPDMAAFIVFASGQPERGDSAIYIQHRDQIKILRHHFTQLQSQASPLLRVFGPNEREAFWVATTVAEETPGDRLLSQHHPAALTTPQTWWRQGTTWAMGLGLGESELNSLIAQQLARQHAFEDQVRTFRYRDICAMRSIRLLTEVGHFTHSPVRPDIALDWHERIEFLRHLIGLLERHTNYELALIDESTEANSLLHNWWVKGDHTVLLETTRPGDETRIEIDLMITEPTLVRGFRDAFEDMWGNIAPQFREKQEVLYWLRAQERYAAMRMT
jgi:hypothetical protein